jgi:hypothetical protein
MNSKNYRDLVLEYVQKLGEIDKAEDQLREFKEPPVELKDQIVTLKKEASNLKQQIDNSKGRNK